jgi:hypothetical protein
LYIFFFFRFFSFSNFYFFFPDFVTNKFPLASGFSSFFSDYLLQFDKPIEIFYGEFEFSSQKKDLKMENFRNFLSKGLASDYLLKNDFDDFEVHFLA